MKRSSLCCASIFAVFCLSLIWLRPIQATNSQSQAGSATQSDHPARLPNSRAALAGHWTVQPTGDAVDIDVQDGKLTAHISATEWELLEDGQNLAATRILSAEDARRLFPDIADAPAALSGKSVTLLLAPTSDEATLDMSLILWAPRSGGRRPRALPLISGSLTRLPVVNNSGESDRTGTGNAELVPQVIGTPTMSVFPSPAPNAFGSPSFAGYTTNAITALGSGLAFVGNPASSPMAYFRVTSLDDRGNIVTGFPSWKGLINPGTAFGVPFASELGNRVHFGLHILGNGTQFKLSNLQFQMHSSDAGDLFQFVGDFSNPSDPSNVYSPKRVGINYGPDRIKGTADDVTITSGPATQLVDELIYVGVGNALAPDDVSCTGTTQATLDCIKGTYDSMTPFKITTTYTLVDDSAHQLSASSGTDDFGNCVTISCPANIVAQAGLSQGSVVVNYSPPTASSPCGETFQVSSLPASGSAFPVGVTTVNVTATDAAGNKSVCAFTVTVKSVVAKLQDPHTGDSLCFDTGAGAYTFTHCGPGGFMLTGTGKVKISGGTVTLLDLEPGRKISASLISNQSTGRATLLLSSVPGVFQTFTINSTSQNPSCSCP